MNPCPRCPVAGGDACLGRRVRRLCDLIDPAHPDYRPGYVDSVVAASRPRGARAPEYPPIRVQAANLAGAVARAATAAVQGEPVKVPHDVYMQRIDTCLRCEFNGEGPYGIRCLKCGCTGMKLMFATEQCPDDPPRWDRWSPE